MQAILHCVALCLPLIAGAGSPAASRLQGIQDEIRASGTGDVTPEMRDRFDRLVRRYLLALGADLGEMARFDLNPDRDNRESRIRAFAGQLRGHVREWPPHLALLFVETVIREQPEGLYELMRGFERGGTQRYIRELSVQSGGDRARARVAAETFLLGEMFEAGLSGEVSRVLAANLATRSSVPWMDVIEIAADLLDRVFHNPGLRAYRTALQARGSSAELAQAIHASFDHELSDPRPPDNERRRRVQRLLGMLVVLQTESAKDHLLLIFDFFDDKYELESVARAFPEYEQLLVQSLAGFVAQNAGVEDPVQRKLALEIVDHLGHAVVVDLEVVRGQLSRERVIDVLLALRDARADILDSYIRRFHSDYHAINPGGYAAVLFRLGDLLIDFAELGRFPAAGAADQQTANPARPDPQPPQHKIVDVARWYRETLAGIDLELPRPQLGAREEQALQRIYGLFELEGSGGEVDLRLIEPPEFFYTALMALSWVAGLADPEAVRKHVLLPLAELRLYARTRRPRSISVHVTPAERVLWRHVGGQPEDRALIEQIYEQGRRPRVN